MRSVFIDYNESRHETWAIIKIIPTIFINHYQPHFSEMVVFKYYVGEKSA